MSNKNNQIDINFHDRKSSSLVDPKKIIEFDKKLRLKVYRLSIGQKEFNLSLKEIDCLYYKGQGFTAKEIARKNGISPRTVETYLNNAKSKSGLSTLNQLIFFCRDEGLF